MILIEHHVMVKVNNISRFFRDEIEIFSNLVVRDEIKICFFYISCFETRSRICFTTSRISRRGQETKQLILEVEWEFSMLILARHFEIENSRQCLGKLVGVPSTGSFLMVCKRRVSLAEVQEKDAVLAKMATIEEGFTFWFLVTVIKSKIFHIASPTCKTLLVWKTTVWIFKANEIKKIYIETKPSDHVKKFLYIWYTDWFLSCTPSALLCWECFY